MGQIEASSNATIATCNGTRSYFVGFNCSNGVFTDKKVRQAMNYAIDMQEIVATFYSGLGAVIPTILSPNAIGYADLDPYGYDPDKAKEMLAEAGYPNGFSVVIDTEDFIKNVAQAYAQMLREVGIDASVQVWEWSILKPELLADLLFSLSQITSDLTEREECFIQGQEIIYEECPMIWGYVTKEVYGVSKRVQNWTPSPDSRINLQDVSVSD
jgi:peptide/nickel transport system substrate-binding protein